MRCNINRHRFCSKSGADFLFRIILCLGIPQRRILSVFFAQQRLMRAVLHDRARIENQNRIAKAAGRETMADINCRFSASLSEKNQSKLSSAGK